MSSNEKQPPNPLLTIPHATLNRLVLYLQTRPWKEAHPLISEVEAETLVASEDDRLREHFFQRFTDEHERAPHGDKKTVAGSDVDNPRD